MIPITVGDNTYTSIAAAWRDEAVEGLPLVTVRWRLKEGWDTKLAFKTPPIPGENRRKNKEIRNG